MRNTKETYLIRELPDRYIEEAIEIISKSYYRKNTLANYIGKKYGASIVKRIVTHRFNAVHSQPNNFMVGAIHNDTDKLEAVIQVKDIFTNEKTEEDFKFRLAKDTSIPTSVMEDLMRIVPNKKHKEPNHLSNQEEYNRLFFPESIGEVAEVMHISSAGDSNFFAIFNMLKTLCEIFYKKRYKYVVSQSTNTVTTKYLQKMNAILLEHRELENQDNNELLKSFISVYYLEVNEEFLHSLA